MLALAGDTGVQTGRRGVAARPSKATPSIRSRCAAEAKFTVVYGPGWKLRAAPLIAGFSSGARLTEPEIRALPAMILWRSVGTVLWRAGRWRRGLDQTALIAERIEDLVHTTDWIDHHGHALITVGLTRASR